MNLDGLYEGIKRNDRRSLARSITLIESQKAEDMPHAQELLRRILPFTGKSFRIGISGVPGAGKSTFIDSFGSLLIARGKKIAVLAIDPSSTVSGGSILGDKTRMERLIQSEAAFVRPSPSGGSLGGVARRTRESILLCEAAGYNTILVETVGVGQSEVEVASMTDFYLLLMLPNAGDELQGIKKGILELADCICVNKEDSDLPAARRTKAELSSALHYLRSRTPEWEIPVLLASALKETGLDEIINTSESFREFTEEKRETGVFQSRRRLQNLEWMKNLAREELLRDFDMDPEIRKLEENLESRVLSGQITPTLGAVELLKAYYEKTRPGR